MHFRRAARLYGGRSGRRNAANTTGPRVSSNALHYNGPQMPPVITSWTQGAWIALDILLVALLIYQVLVMIRGTRAVPMLVGLTVLAVLFYFARVGELTTLNWVVSHVLPYVVFALIVVFQSEIRHVLADLGRRFTFLGGLVNRQVMPTTTSFSPRISFPSIKPAP